MEAETEESRFDQSVWLRADWMVTNDDKWADLFNRAAQSPACRKAAADFFGEVMGTTKGSTAARKLKTELTQVADDLAREELE